MSGLPFELLPPPFRRPLGRRCTVLMRAIGDAAAAIPRAVGGAGGRGASKEDRRGRRKCGVSVSCMLLR